MRPIGLSSGDALGMQAMRFFNNSSINRIYLHSALMGLSEYSGEAFVLVFLLKSGIVLPFVFLSSAAVVLMRLLFRQVVPPFAQRFGIRRTLIVGIAIEALAMVPIGFVHDVGPMLACFITLTALGGAFYWACFHATSAKLGDAEARGAQVSVVQMIYAMSNIAGPLMGGFLQTATGPIFAFLVAGVIRLLSAWPLLATPDIRIDTSAKIDSKSKRFAAQIYFFDGFGNACVGNAFRLALFITLGESFQAFGSALAGAAMLGAVMGLGIGRLFDLGHHKWSTSIGMCAVALFIIVAAFGYGHAVTAVTALALGAMAGPLYASAYNARVYNLSNASGDALRFQIWGEGGWDMGCALGSCLAALLIFQGFSFAWPIAIGLVGTAGVWFTLHQSYQKADPSLRV
jgi:MFS transporter, DHA1 family, inner membrane transport protein